MIKLSILTSISLLVVVVVYVAYPAAYAEDHNPLLDLEESLVFEVQGENYVSGGISQEERAMLKKINSRYSLKIEMAQKSGAYIGGAMLTIVNEQGDTVVQSRTDGPIFLAALEPGKYVVYARHRGANFEKNIVISRSKNQKRINFYFDDDTTDYKPWMEIDSNRSLQKPVSDVE